MEDVDESSKPPSSTAVSVKQKAQKVHKGERLLGISRKRKSKTSLPRVASKKARPDFSSLEVGVVPDVYQLDNTVVRSLRIASAANQNEKLDSGFRKTTDVEVKRSEMHGDGLFAMRDFKKDENIVEYIGEVLTEEQFKTRYSDDKPAYVLDLNNSILDASDVRKSNFARYANHKPMSQANARFTKTAWLRATKAIYKGQEIFVDYGRDYWKGRTHLKKTTI